MCGRIHTLYWLQRVVLFPAAVTTRSYYVPGTAEGEANKLWGMGSDVGEPISHAREGASCSRASASSSLESESSFTKGHYRYPAPTRQAQLYGRRCRAWGARLAPTGGCGSWRQGAGCAKQSHASGKPAPTTAPPRSRRRRRRRLTQTPRPRQHRRQSTTTRRSPPQTTLVNRQHRSPQNLHATACAPWSKAPAEPPRLSGRRTWLTTVPPRSRRRRRRRLTPTPRPCQHRRQSTTTRRRPPRTTLVQQLLFQFPFVLATCSVSKLPLSLFLMITHCSHGLRQHHLMVCQLLALTFGWAAGGYLS